MRLIERGSEFIKFLWKKLFTTSNFEALESSWNQIKIITKKSVFHYKQTKKKCCVWNILTLLCTRQGMWPRTEIWNCVNLFCYLASARVSATSSSSSWSSLSSCCVCVCRDCRRSRGCSALLAAGYRRRCRLDGLCWWYVDMRCSVCLCVHVQSTWPYYMWTHCILWRGTMKRENLHGARRHVHSLLLLMTPLMMVRRWWSMDKYSDVVYARVFVQHRLCACAWDDCLLYTRYRLQHTHNT